MKVRHSFLILLTAAIPMLVTAAEDASKTETANSQTTSEAHDQNATDKDAMVCKCGTISTNLDKLIADMNGATADKKVDAIAAAVTKLAEELKAARQQSETKTATNEKSEMGMCKMMMGMEMKDSGDDQEGDHEHHH
jgi:hypothetical protein